MPPSAFEVDAKGGVLGDEEPNSAPESGIEGGAVESEQFLVRLRLRTSGSPGSNKEVVSLTMDPLKAGLLANLLLLP